MKVPKLKKAALMISLVPDDVGKPTFKLEKAEVKEGICSWENPIYVSVKLIKEPKSGIVREKIYHFVVATVSEFNNKNVFSSSCDRKKNKRYGRMRERNLLIYGQMVNDRSFGLVSLLPSNLRPQKIIFFSLFLMLF